ncbi:MAG: branched-chain amino acid ABC transporter permease [Candidatus Caldarchaeum sp.]
MIELAASLIRVLQTGALYALMATGLTLTLSILRIPNVAHAEYVTIGAYVSFVLINFAGLALWQAIPPSFLLGALAAILSYVLVFKPLRKRGVSMFILMVASFAVSLIIRYMIYAVVAAGNWGLGVKPKVVVNVAYRVAGITITDLFLLVLPLSIALTSFLHLFMTRTRTGKQMRAVSDDPDLAVVSGVNVEKVALITFLISGGLAGLAGSLWVVFTHAHPDLGLEALLRMIAASALGGFVSYPGTLAGAFIVTFAENTVMDFLNRTFGISLAFKPLMPMIITIIVLVSRPSGLTGLLSSREQAAVKK